MFCVLQSPPYRLRMKQSIEDSEWQLQRLLHLSAAADAAETPVAEVLAVIGQQVPSGHRHSTARLCFAQTHRACSTDAGGKTGYSHRYRSQRRFPDAGALYHGLQKVRGRHTMPMATGATPCRMTSSYSALNRAILVTRIRWLQRLFRAI